MIVAARRGRWLSLLLTLAVGCQTAPPEPDAGTPDAGPAPCTGDRACDDGLFCNGQEACEPGGAGTDERGCREAAADRCLEGQTCDEPGERCVTDCSGGDDADGDGAASVDCDGDDCDDSDADRFPGNPERCDAESHDEDCDGATFGDKDSDGDTFVDAMCCNVEGAARTCGDDCDDATASSHPTSTEVCNEADDDCDGAIDETVLRTFHPDLDGDGSGDARGAPRMACNPRAGEVENATDCDDGSTRRSPTRVELCDAVDNDCDATVDEETEDVSWYLDADGDGWGRDDATPVTSCLPIEGHATQDGDCDDNVSAVHPSRAESCDAIDNDCDAIIDETVERTFYVDADGDGFGNSSILTSGCDTPPGSSALGGDCDDTQRGRNPGLPEICDLIDDNDCDAATAPFDADGDDHDVSSCGGDDCDDASFSVHPLAPELCDRRDTVCRAGGGVRAEEDADADGFAPVGTPLCAGGPLPRTDCDDTSALTSPSGAERCGGGDQDCDGTDDEEPAASASCSLANASSSCSAGACAVVACSGTFRNCDALSASGCERDITRSRDHCGACGAACPVGAICIGSTCVARHRWSPSTTEVLEHVAVLGDTVFAAGQFKDAPTVYGRAIGPSGGGNDVVLVAVDEATGATARWIAWGGGSNDDAPRAITAIDGAARDHVVVVGDGASIANGGMTFSGVDVDAPGARAGFVVAYDAAGAAGAASVRWARGIGGGPTVRVTPLTVHGNDTQVVAGGEYAGDALDLGFGNESPPASVNGFVVAYSTIDGAPRWRQICRASGGASVRAVAASPSGDRIWAACNFRGTAFFGGLPYVAGPGGGVLLTEMDATGLVIGTRQLSSGTEIHDLEVDASGDVWLTGRFTGHLELPGAAPIVLDSAYGVADWLIAAVSPGRTFRWAHRIGTSDDEPPASSAVVGLALDAAGAAYVVGQLGPSGTVDMGGGPQGCMPDDVVIAAYAPGGAHRWLRCFTGARVFSPAVAAGAAGRSYYAVIIASGVDFGGGPRFVTSAPPDSVLLSFSDP